MNKNYPIIQVKRFLFNNDTTISKCFVKGDPFCFGLEDERRKTKVKGETCIPEGVYELGLHNSPRFSKVYGHPMLHIKNVPGFEYILIHPGNTDENTDGCYLPGLSIDLLNTQAAVLQSKLAYTKVYNAVIAAVTKGGQYISFESLNSLNPL